MYRLEIRLPQDRRFCGHLTLYAPSGEMLLGPMPIAGKSSEQISRNNCNPTRTALLPYGDTPCGSYRFSRLLSMRKASQVDVARYGRFGIAVFDPCAGDAALAEAAGRFELWFHGGSTSEAGLASTAGSLRLSDKDQQQLMRILCRCGDISCTISTDSTLVGKYGEVNEDTRSDYVDPPALNQVAPAVLSYGAILSSLTYAHNPGLLYLGEYDSGQYFSSIDLTYIANNEGGDIASVYVPIAGDGYTVGIGVNLSAQSQQGLLNMGVDPATVKALASVIGVYPPDGSTTAPGITLTAAQSLQLSTAVTNSYFNAVGQSYSNTSKFANFADLPTQAQTALADLQYNLPGGVSRDAPTLWTQVTTGNWQGAVDNLMGTNGQPAFSSQGPLNTRAKADGALLQQALNAGTLPKP